MTAKLEQHSTIDGFKSGLFRLCERPPHFSNDQLTLADECAILKHYNLDADTALLVGLTLNVRKQWRGRRGKALHRMTLAEVIEFVQAGRCSE